MRELGQLLRTTRESLGLDLDEVQERTKIRKRYLMALESGDWSVLPGDVYARGFVRSYAEVLGIDGLELLRTYVDQRGSTTGGSSPVGSTDDTNLPQNDDVTHIQSHAPRSAEQRPFEDRNRRSTIENPNRPRREARPASEKTKLLANRKFGGVSQIAVVVGGLIVIGGGIWVFHHDRSGGAPSAAPDINSTASSTYHATNTTSTTSTTAGNLTNGTTSGSNQSTGNAASNGSASSSSTTSTVTPGVFENNQQSYTVNSTSPLSVTMQATSGSCWVKVTADNNVIDNSDMINQGSSKTWTANQTLTIRLGNVPAVQLTVNGQPVTLPSTSNVIVVTFVRQST